MSGGYRRKGICCRVEKLQRRWEPSGEYRQAGRLRPLPGVNAAAAFRVLSVASRLRRELGGGEVRLEQVCWENVMGPQREAAGLHVPVFVLWLRGGDGACRPFRRCSVASRLPFSLNDSIVYRRDRGRSHRCATNFSVKWIKCSIISGFSSAR